MRDHRAPGIGHKGPFQDQPGQGLRRGLLGRVQGRGSPGGSDPDPALVVHDGRAQVAVLAGQAVAQGEGVHHRRPRRAACPGEVEPVHPAGGGKVEPALAVGLDALNVGTGQPGQAVGSEGLPAAGVSQVQECQAAPQGAGPQPGVAIRAGARVQGVDGLVGQARGGAEGGPAALLKAGDAASPGAHPQHRLTVGARHRAQARHVVVGQAVLAREKAPAAPRPESKAPGGAHPEGALPGAVLRLQQADHQARGQQPIGIFAVPPGAVLAGQALEGGHPEVLAAGQEGDDVVAGQVRGADPGHGPPGGIAHETVGGAHPEGARRPGGLGETGDLLAGQAQGLIEGAPAAQVQAGHAAAPDAEPHGGLAPGHGKGGEDAWGGQALALAQGVPPAVPEPPESLVEGSDPQDGAALGIPGGGQAGGGGPGRKGRAGLEDLPGAAIPAGEAARPQAGPYAPAAIPFLHAQHVVGRATGKAVRRSQHPPSLALKAAQALLRGRPQTQGSVRRPELADAPDGAGGQALLRSPGAPAAIFQAGDAVVAGAHPEHLPVLGVPGFGQGEHVVGRQVPAAPEVAPGSLLETPEAAVLGTEPDAAVPGRQDRPDVLGGALLGHPHRNPALSGVEGRPVDGSRPQPAPGIGGESVNGAAGQSMLHAPDPQGRTGQVEGGLGLDQGPSQEAQETQTHVQRLRHAQG